MSDGKPSPAVGWVVRPAGDGDLDQIVRLESVCFAPPWPREDLRQILKNPLISARVVEARCAEAACAGAEHERTLVAYALFRTVAGEAELLRIGVEPAERGNGLARRVLADALETLHRAGVSLCHLEVRADNAPALALYRRLGFEMTGRRPRYYPGDLDALLLTCRLPATVSVESASVPGAVHGPEPPRRRDPGSIS